MNELYNNILPESISKWEPDYLVISLRSYWNFALRTSALFWWRDLGRSGLLEFRHHSPRGFATFVRGFAAKLNKTKHWRAKSRQLCKIEGNSCKFTPLVFSLNLIWLACYAFWSQAIVEGLKPAPCLSAESLDWSVILLLFCVKNVRTLL